MLRQLWELAEPVTGRQLLDRMGRPGLRYTTLMTVLGRLAGKGLAERLPEGTVVRYRAAGDLDELTARAIGELLDAARDPRAVLAHLVRDLDDADLAAELTRIVAAPRRRAP